MTIICVHIHAQIDHVHIVVEIYGVYSCIYGIDDYHMCTYTCTNRSRTYCCVVCDNGALHTRIYTHTTISHTYCCTHKNMIMHHVHIVVCDNGSIALCHFSAPYIRYGVATISRLLKIIGLFCKIYVIKHNVCDNAPRAAHTYIHTHNYITYILLYAQKYIKWICVYSHVYCIT